VIDDANAFERVYTTTDYHDGPRVGIASEPRSMTRETNTCTRSMRVRWRAVFGAGATDLSTSASRRSCRTRKRSSASSKARSSSSIGHRWRIYMCMELLNGAALSDTIQQPMGADRLLNILVQTDHGLAAARERHRPSRHEARGDASGKPEARWTVVE
jgi:hypothetical protein